MNALNALKAALETPFFGIAITVLSFGVGRLIGRRVRSPLANAYVISTVFIIAFLQIADIPLETYALGGDVMSLMLVPATAILATIVYRQRTLLAANLVPMIAGCLVGAATSLASIYFLCRFFGIDETIAVSLLPKSVTNPIAMELSTASGGIASLTVAAVVFTGMVGAVCAPLMLTLLKIKNPVAAGIAIGTSSHVLGTAKAIEIGETQGAASGIAVCLAGMSTVVLYMFL